MFKELILNSLIFCFLFSQSYLTLFMKVEFIPYKGYDRIKPFTKLQLNYICLFSQINLILSLYILIPVNVIGDNHRIKLTAKYLFIF